jgi:hypothetical protein
MPVECVAYAYLSDILGHNIQNPTWSDSIVLPLHILKVVMFVLSVGNYKYECDAAFRGMKHVNFAILLSACY